MAGWTRLELATSGVTGPYGVVPALGSPSDKQGDPRAQRAIKPLFWRDLTRFFAQAAGASGRPPVSNGQAEPGRGRRRAAETQLPVRFRLMARIGRPSQGAHEQFRTSDAGCILKLRALLQQESVRRVTHACRRRGCDRASSPGRNLDGPWNRSTLGFKDREPRFVGCGPWG